MPFQDIEDTDVPPMPRAPSPVERWTRKVLLEDWTLKLLAIAITVVLWLAVTGQNKPVTMRVSGVQLNFVKQDGMEISNEVPGTVDVILNGSPGRLDQISPRGLIATVDVTDQKAGERIIRLASDRVLLELPEGVKIEGFRPSSIPIRLEPTVEAQVEVEVKLEGALPDGFELAGSSTSPAKIRLRGPADHISQLRKVATETVLIDGKTASFTVPNVAINVHDPKIEVLDPTVDVRIEIVEKKRGDVHQTFASGTSILVAQNFSHRRPR
ncbi:MAG TPA: CdaR family protein [Pyrinomonadaceae bacterium]|nr:CdaR family protein [Pyrinomonadaceae bacterium]